MKKTCGLVRAAIFAVVGMTVTFAQPRANATTLRVYHVGNSVTDTLRYNGVTAQAAQMGHAYTFGKHISAGASLPTIYNYTSTSGHFHANGFGLYRDALDDFTWDAITLEPFDNSINGTNGDLVYAKNFINYALPQSPNAQFYVYSRWPRKVDDGNGNLALNYEQKWLTPYTYTGTNPGNTSNETKGFFESLVDRLNSDLPNLNKNVLMVPVGDVLLEVDQRMRAGQVPGYTSVNQLYTDHIHFNDTGSYIVGMTFFATMYRDNPMNTAKPANWAGISAAQAAQFQSAVWDVVSGHAYSGVIPGDFTRDGRTDINDFSILASRFNKSATSLAQGDTNGDRFVDITDFSLLAASFNVSANGSSATLATVPEPGAVGVIALLAAALKCHRRREPLASN
jgi:hypothetical protein